MLEPDTNIVEALPHEAFKTYATWGRIGQVGPIELSTASQRKDQSKYPAATRSGAEIAHGHAGLPYGAIACMFFVEARYQCLVS